MMAQQQRWDQWAMILFVRQLVKSLQWDYQMIAQQSSHEPNMCNEPHVGMAFTTEADAYDFFNEYSFRIGFGIRKDKGYKSVKKDEATMKRYLCSCAGKFKSKATGTPKRNRVSKKSDCKTLMKVDLSSNNLWVVTELKLEHNHMLFPSPSKAKFFHSHKKIGNEVLEVVRRLHYNNIGHGPIMDMLCKMFEGPQNMPFTSKDISNRKAKLTREDIARDIEKTLEWFDEMKANNSNFYFEVDVDENNRLRNIFWCNASSRAAYQHFGDVIIFDTTYKTNRFNMPLAPFLGVNHHMQTVFFGCALLHDEKAESFAWLLKTFLKSMDNKHPVGILTDQDPAMEKAIREILPNTVHRLCKWHVLKKSRDQLLRMFDGNKKLKAELHVVIMNPFTPVEFEAAWATFIERNGLQDVPVMQALYMDRERWVPCYFRDVFFGNMTSTQWSESMNAVVKKYFVDHKTSLHNFALEMNRLIQTIKVKEDKETFDQEGNTTTPTMYKFDVQVSALYTRTVYGKFKDELHESTAYVIESAKNGRGGQKLFTLKHQDYEEKQYWE